VTETLDHIIRNRIPWQTDKGITECGKEVSSVKAAMSWEDFAAKFKREGQQRAAMTTCMTCWGRYETMAHLQQDWKHSPSSVIGRECQRIEYRSGYGASKTDNQLDREFRALAALVEAHRDEFDGYLTGLESTVNMADARANRKTRTIAGRTGPRPL
jgi:hypothetical protein